MGHGNFQGFFALPQRRLCLEGKVVGGRTRKPIKRGGCASDEAEARR